MTNDDIVDTLNDLIETSKDGEYGFRTSAESLKNPEIRSLFERRAQECKQAATELAALVPAYGGRPQDSGSVSGAVHRGWVAVKGTLSGYSEKTILEESERGEDTAMARYRAALEKSLPPEIRSVVERQFEGVKRNHVQVRTLRDKARAADT